MEPVTNLLDLGKFYILRGGTRKGDSSRTAFGLGQAPLVPTRDVAWASEGVKKSPRTASPLRHRAAESQANLRGRTKRPLTRPDASGRPLPSERAV